MINQNPRNMYLQQLNNLLYRNMSINKLERKFA